MGFSLKNLLGLGAEKIIDSVTGLVDEVVTNKEEAQTLKNKLFEQMSALDISIGEEVTKRLQADMASDSWLSKNIRPMTLIFILIVYSAFSVLDGNIGEFIINQDYITLMGQWGKAVMFFYFGGRTIEKSVDFIVKSKERNKNK